MPLANDPRKKLIRLLQMAYSGERAAGYAYSSHWRSLRHADERSRVQVIEKEEWVHREAVGRMLAHLGAEPQLWRELIMAIIGRIVGLACFVIGRFLAMYFAGKLEGENIQEYAQAAVYAEQLGLHDFSLELTNLSEVEKQHELFFINMVMGHWMLPSMRVMFRWGPVAASVKNTD